MGISSDKHEQNGHDGTDTKAPVIPTIDISPYLENPNSEAATKVVDAVQEACTWKGFFQITGHGITRELQMGAFEAAKAFFALPMEEKIKLDRRTVKNANGRGYECLNSQMQNKGQAGDSKEGYYISCEIPEGDPLMKKHPGIQAPNVWPSAEVIPESVFRQPIQAYHDALLTLINKVFRVMAAGLPTVPQSVFDEFATNPIALLSPKHYPPKPEASGEDVIGSGAHTDFGAVTLLLQDGNAGLEVKDGDSWIPVAPNQDAYVVNIGDMFQKWTRGMYKSTIHRVVAPENVNRYSMPFFFDGNPAFKLVPFDGEREGDEIHTVEQHLTSRFRKMTLPTKGQTA